MRNEHDGDPHRWFAAERRASRFHSEAIDAMTFRQTQPVPGRSTLTGSLAPAPLDVTRTFDEQLEIANRQLVALEVANHAGDHHESARAASGLRTALRIAGEAVTRLRVESEHRATALDRRLISAWEAARPSLDQAFMPSPAAIREAPAGGRVQWDRFTLKIPAKIGDVVQKVALARWSRTFSGTISSGVPILQAIEISGQTAGNAVIKEAMDDVYASVKRGGSIAAPLAANSVFPPMVSHMVSVGEESGQLQLMLDKVADFYDAEVDAKVKALTSLIEPLMICIVGIMVGFIVISMYLPIFSLYDKIG